MNKSFNKDYVDKRKLDHKLRNNMYYNDLKYIEKNLKKEYLNTNLNFLDIGCSDGEFAKLLMQKFAVIAHGIEINKELANNAKKKLRKVYNKIDGKVPFQNYDVIILRGTIHYLSSNEINLILKKSNKKCIIILLQNINSKSIPFRMLGPNRILVATPSQDFDGNTFFYNRKSLLNLFKPYNFTELSFDYPYLSTPYRKLKSDFYALLVVFNPLNKNIYKNAFFRNIFRAIYVKLNDD
jgi:hypothetical protein